MFARVENRIFQGKAGDIDCVVEWPDETPVGWALVLHPHPLHGGARNNKVVTTVARACLERGLVTVRPDFRGVGKSGGEFDAAVGETADMQALSRQFSQAWPDVAAGHWVLAGFSFGTAVAAQLYSVLHEQSQQSPAGQQTMPNKRPQPDQHIPHALILLGTAVERFRFRDVVVPDDTLLIHGELDEVVPMAEAMEFARPHGLPLVVIPDATHFFHGKLVVLRQLVDEKIYKLKENA